MITDRENQSENNYRLSSRKYFKHNYTIIVVTKTTWKY